MTGQMILKLVPGDAHYRLEQEALRQLGIRNQIASMKVTASRYRKGKLDLTTKEEQRLLDAARELEGELA